MSRALDAALLAAMNSGVFTPWFELQLIGSDRATVVFSTTDVLGFEMDGLTCKVTFHDPDYYNDYYTFRLLRGITVEGVPNYVTSSNYWPISDRHEKRLRTLEGHVFPNSYFTTPGDVTYHELIDTVCSEFDLSVVFADPAAAWLDYQFYPAGRTLVLNDAKQFFTILRQKYLIFATDYDEDTLFFYQATATAPSYPSGYITVVPGKVAMPGHGAYKEKSFLSRDENMTSHTSGGTSKPLHNLGFLPSTASHPARYWFTDTNDWIIQDIPPNLKYLDFDAISVTFDISTLLMWPVKFREVFNKKLSPSWQWQAKYLDVFGNTEGGTIPSTLEASAPYTPLNVSEFNKNLNTTHNNLQAFANKVDEMDCGPGMYAGSAKDPLVDGDEFPVIDSETATHLVRKFTWANLKARVFAAFGLSVNGAGAKATPVNGDLIPLVDSETAGKLVRNFTWANLKANLSPFIGARLFLSATLGTTVANNYTLLHLTGETFDVGSIANVTTHEITIPVNGYYFVSAAVGFNNMTADRIGTTAVFLDGVCLLTVDGGNGGAISSTVPVSGIFHFTAGQKLTLYYYSTGATTTDVLGEAGGYSTWLSVILFKAD